MAATNLATYELNETVATARSAEVPDASFSDGVNRGGSNAPGVGINTGNFDPKAEDWPRIEDTAARTSQHIGGVPDVDGDTGTNGFPIQVIQGADTDDNVAFVEAEALTAPDAVLDAATGAVNKTGADVPAGSWVWGVIPVV